MTRPLVATVISCRQREQARAETIPQLESIGLDPLVVLSPCDDTQPAGGRGNALASSQAIKHALTVGADLLFCEDDIDLAPDFPRFLNLARRERRVTYFYLHDVGHYMTHRYGAALTNAILTRQPIRAGLYELKTARNLSGSQCIYLPHEELRRAPTHVFQSGNRPMDIWLSQWLHSDGITPLVALPHPVQHRQVRVARVKPNQLNPDKYSRSFGLERRWGDE